MTHKTPIMFSLRAMIEADDTAVGFCVACGAECEQCEPDTQERPCDVCGSDSVYGAEQIVIMELIDRD